MSAGRAGPSTASAALASMSSSDTARGSASGAEESSPDGVDVRSAAERRPLLLGEAPSEAGDRYHAFPLSGSPATRICRLMGWALEGAAYWTLIEHFETLNAIERWADAEPWSTVRARMRWNAYRAERGPSAPRVVVALGRRAAYAAGLPDGLSWGTWVELAWPVGGRYAVTVIPHTSGRSRVWNDPATKGLVFRVLTESIERAK